jgi:hypothetical protein
MHYRSNMQVKSAIDLGFDPDELGLNRERYYCLKCDVGLQVYLGRRLDWTVEAERRGPLDETASLRLLLIQAYRVGYEDGSIGR